MSRSISISYRRAGSDERMDIEVRSPYDLLGGQRSSMEFWGLGRLKEIGIVHLAELGVTDPVMFIGWDDLAVLGREIDLLWRHLASVPYHVEVKATWLSHLVYCYQLLAGTAPADSEPWLMIG